MYRVGIIGLGYRGKYLLYLLRQMSEWLRVVSVADPFPDKELDLHGIALYCDGTADYRRMLDTERLDLTIIASPWDCHIEHALYAASCKSNIALEIKAGLGLGEYDELIRVVEESDLRVYPLENALFKREVLALWEMTKAGVLGELVYMRGGYRHDLRAILLSDEKLSTSGEGKWRASYYFQGQADIYPTHGFAPLALMAGLGRTDTIVQVQGFASRALGLIVKSDEDTASELSKLGNNLLGDVICTQITTERGVLITLTHDTTLPRPRSLDWEVQGTRGIWNGDRRQIYIEGISPKETWEDDAIYLSKYEHIYWQKWGLIAPEIDKHHKGMDFVMLRAMLADMMNDIKFPVGIRDLALWCSITSLSQASIKS